MAKKFLTKAERVAQAKYMQEIAPARTEHDKAYAVAQAKYEFVIASAQAELNEARNAADREFRRATYFARRHYEDAMAKANATKSR